MEKWYEFHWFDRLGNLRRANTIKPEVFAKGLEAIGIFMYVAYEKDGVLS